MATSWYRDRREADALQQALERFERLLRDGIRADEAGAAIQSGLEPGLARLFMLSAGLRRAGARAPEPGFARVFEERLRAARVVRRIEPRRQSRGPGLATLAAAACIVLVAGVLFSASRSLPGDALYGVKRASETAQVGLASGPAEARLRLGFAQTRLEEVEGLLARARQQVVGAPGTAVASEAADISDPMLSQLIKDTLEEAKRQITTAADILIADPTDAESLDRLAEVARQGSTIAADVARDLPASEKPPILDTALVLAEVEAQAKAARDKIPPTPTPPPCDTPTPTVTPSPATGTAEPTPTPEAPSPSPSASPSATPGSTEPTPSPTPCISPSPSPTPSPEVSPSPGTSPEPTSDPESSGEGNGGPSEDTQASDGHSTP